MFAVVSSTIPDLLCYINTCKQRRCSQPRRRSLEGVSAEGRLMHDKCTINNVNRFGQPARFRDLANKLLYKLGGTATKVQLSVRALR